MVFFVLNQTAQVVHFFAFFGGQGRRLRETLNLYCWKYLRQHAPTGWRSPRQIVLPQIQHAFRTTPTLFIVGREASTSFIVSTRQRMLNGEGPVCSLFLLTPLWITHNMIPNPTRLWDWG